MIAYLFIGTTEAATDSSPWPKRPPPATLTKALQKPTRLYLVFPNLEKHGHPLMNSARRLSSSCVEFEEACIDRVRLSLIMKMKDNELNLPPTKDSLKLHTKGLPTKQPFGDAAIKVTLSLPYQKSISFIYLWKSTKIKWKKKARLEADWGTWIGAGVVS